MDSPARPSRRALLATVPVVAVPVLVGTGCTVGRTAPPPGPTAAEVIDDQVRTHARSREADLIAAYEQATAMHPGLAALLNPIRDHHARHAAALVPPAATASPSPGAAPTTSTTPTARAGPGPLAVGTDTPTGRATTVAALRTLERRAALAGRDACLAASPAFAPVLASIRAAETAHDDLLDAARV